MSLIKWYKKNCFFVNVFAIPILVVIVYFKIASMQTVIIEFDLVPDDVAYIVLRSGRNGQKVAVTEREDINYICSNFNALEILYDPPSGRYMGWYMTIQFFDENDEAPKSLTLIGDGTLQIGKPIEGSSYIDTDFLDSMMEKYPETDMMYPRRLEGVLP